MHLNYTTVFKSGTKCLGKTFWVCCCCFCFSASALVPWNETKRHVSWCLQGRAWTQKTAWFKFQGNRQQTFCVTESTLLEQKESKWVAGLFEIGWLKQCQPRLIYHWEYPCLVAVRNKSDQKGFRVGILIKIKNRGWHQQIAILF